MLVQRATRELLHGAHFIEHLIARSAADFASQRLDHTQWRDRRPHSHRHEFGPTTRETVRELSERIIKLRAHLGLIVASESPMADMANYAHYHKGAVAHVWHPQALPHGVLSGEGALCQDIINDDDGLAAHAIAILEESTAAQRYAHHRQVLRRH